MVSSKFKVRNPNGLHLKPAGFLCNVALEYDCKITLHTRGKYVNAKSVIGVLSACVKGGEEIEIICEGVDEQQALERMLICFESGLGELF